MRIITSTLILLTAVCGGAQAEKQTAVNASIWTGFYTGVSLGAIINESHLDANHLNFLDTQPYGERLDSTDVLPGIHAGYNYQLPSGWVVGGEADFTYPDSDSRFIHSILRNDPDTGIDVNVFDKFTFKNRLQGAVRGRIGYAVDDFLPFITAGVSFADIGMRYDNEFNDVYKKDSVQVGWILGAGLEYAFFGNFSVRTEYLYTDYGDPVAVAMSIPTVDGETDSNGSAKIDLVSHSVRAALNYRF